MLLFQEGSKIPWPYNFHARDLNRSQQVAAVNNWPKPETLMDLRQFLGLASYYRKFVAGFAQDAAPLHELVGVLAKEIKGTK